VINALEQKCANCRTEHSITSDARWCEKIIH